MQRDTLNAMYVTLHATAARFGFGMASFRSEARMADLASVRRVQAGRHSLLTPLEAVQLISAVRATAALGGVMAEVGVYQGASARLIRETDPTRPLHLFDTFSGLPAPTTGDTHRHGMFEPGEFAADLDGVRDYLADLPGITLHPGRFPETAGPVDAARFSFVHLDVDLYESTRDSLAWFYPRLLPGGIVIAHDYGTAAGPRRAFDEWALTHPDPMIALVGNQAMLVKTHCATR